MTERAYKFRFYPNTEQENLLRRTMGCVRLVYNKALSVRTEAWYEQQERIGYSQTSSLLTGWKQTEELHFLNEVSCVPLQQCLRHLQKAFANFWGKRAKYPRFKKKRNGGSAEFTKSAFKWENGASTPISKPQLFLAKCQEPLAMVWSRCLPKGATPSTVTVKLDPSGRWFVSLLVNEEIEPLRETHKKVGIDAGITNLVATSNGEKVVNPKHFNRLYRRLKRAQKDLSRKTKGSKNRDKARQKVARIHAEIKDARQDFLHKLTTRLVRENQTIAVEDLAVRNMVKNHKLARAISDAGWGEMFRQLEYKCQWYGRELVKIDRFFPSSKRCGKCGHVVETMPLKVREWTCPECGTSHDRDINAAQNILAAGLAVTVCGADVRPDRHRAGGQLRKTRQGKKQKPKS
ncbi:MAG: RNA-guided endonuclease InsQ/TnpB family protein [Spirulina sp.]